MSKSPIKISAAARTRIDNAMKQLTADTGVEVIPSIHWEDAAANGRRGSSGILIGAFKASQRDEIIHLIRNDDGYEYALNVTDKDSMRFAGKTLDCQDGKYVLV